MEIWKDYIYNYQISNYGRVRNKITNHILKLNKVGKGYLGVCVSLGERGKVKMIRPHRAVAELFIPNPDNLPQVNHIDGNKTNNQVNNLEWCDNKYNIIHALNNGLIEPLKGEAKYNSKLNRQDVIYIRTHYKPRDKNFGVRALAKKYNVHHETIRQVLTNETWN